MAKVDVIQLRGRWVNSQADFALAAAVARARDRGHDVAHRLDIFGSALLTRARNQSLKAVRPDSNFVLFVDDDMLPVEAALTRLIDHDKSVVSALCTTRSMPPRIAAKLYDKETGMFTQVPEFGDNSLICGPWSLGFGFLLIKTSVLFTVIEYVLSAQDWVELNREQLNRLHVRSEVREKERQRLSAIRRRLWDAEGTAPVFQMPLNDFQFEIGEDMHFSRLLHHLEIETWIDTGVLVGHLGDFPYSPLHCGITHATEVEL